MAEKNCDLDLAMSILDSEFPDNTPPGGGGTAGREDHRSGASSFLCTEKPDEVIPSREKDKVLLIKPLHSVFSQLINR